MANTPHSPGIKRGAPTQRPLRTLSDARARLVGLMRRMVFGRIEGLQVRNGEPVMAPRPRVVLEVKFGGENGPAPVDAGGDFHLKAQVVELLDRLDLVGNGTVDLIEVKNGVPFKMLIADGAA